jgi:hypothetical protein
MPFQSRAQQRFLFATNPKVAKDFADKTPPSAYANLPQHVSDRRPPMNHANLANLKLHRKAKKVTIPPQRKGQQPITFQPGGLHASLGVPQGQPIPEAAKAAALSGARGAKAKKQALFAKNVLHR